MSKPIIPTVAQRNREHFERVGLVDKIKTIAVIGAGAAALIALLDYISPNVLGPIVGHIIVIAAFWLVVLTASNQQT